MNQLQQPRSECMHYINMQGTQEETVLLIPRLYILIEVYSYSKDIISKGKMIEGNYQDMGDGRDN